MTPPAGPADRRWDDEETPTPPATATPATPPTTVEELIRQRLALALGGWRGALETALPTAVFVALWVWREDLRSALLAAGAVALALALARLAQRSSLQHVIGSVVATGIAAFFALRSGKAEDAFLPGILLSAAYGVGTIVSIFSRWPVVGFLIGVADPRAQTDPFAWRRDSAIVKVCQRLTWVLVALYAVRLAIMVPLYLAHNVAALGVAKIALGWPLWLAGVGVMGLLLVRGHTPLERASDPSEDPEAVATH